MNSSPSLSDLMLDWFAAEMPFRNVSVAVNSYFNLSVDGANPNVNRIKLLPIYAGGAGGYSRDMLIVDGWTVGEVQSDKFQAYGCGCPLLLAADPSFFPDLKSYIETALKGLKPGELLVVG